MQRFTIIIGILVASLSAHAEYYPILDFQVYGSPASTADEASINATMNSFWTAWAEHDAAGVASAHTSDAEWTNAFGRTFRGAKTLEEFLADNLFPDFDIAISKGEAESFIPISRRYIGSEAAVITGRLESNRGSPTGSSNRKIGFTFVLAKVGDEWKISNQVITDLRERRG